MTPRSRKTYVTKKKKKSSYAALKSEMALYNTRYDKPCGIYHQFPNEPPTSLPIILTP